MVNGKTAMLRAVLFDLYGTLFLYGDMKSAWRAWTEDLRGALRELGIAVTFEELAQLCDGFFSGSVVPDEGLTVYEMRLSLFARRLGVLPNDAWVRETARSTLDCWQAYIVPDPEAEPLLRALRARGMRLGAITNFDHPPHIELILRHAGLRQFLDCVIVSGAVGLKKPDARIFELALRELGIGPGESLFVGDHPEQDVEGARAAGLGAVLVQRGSGVDRLQVNYWADMRSGPDRGAEKANSALIIAGLAELPKRIAPAS